MNGKVDSVKPFLRWAGGKRWIATELAKLIPSDMKTYYEPFLGGGSLFFGTLPKPAVLADVNCRLVEAYQMLRDCPKTVISVLRNWRNEEQEYYWIRKTVFENKAYRAAQFIYLNRTCWNGLYRVNRQGKFNVPFGNHGREVYDPEHLMAVSNALKGVELRCGDFAQSVRHAGRGDFVYLDPPFVAREGARTFNKYSKETFTWSDQQRLGCVAVGLAKRGCHIVVSNVNKRDIIQLYPGFYHKEISRNSILAANPKFRGPTSELLLVSVPNILKDST